MSEQVDLSKWKKLVGRFHGSEVKEWRNNPRVKVVKTDKTAPPFPGSPKEDFDDQTLYEAYVPHDMNAWLEL